MSDSLMAISSLPLPALVISAGPQACRHYVEFFTATIRNQNTRNAYAVAVGQFFDWCDHRRFTLELIEPVTVAAYIEQLCRTQEPATAKQHLAAIRMIFDHLVVRQVVPNNPAASVRGPKHVVKRGKTPVLSAEDARILLDSIPITRRLPDGSEQPDLLGLRDRALIAAMIFSFARVSAVIGMDGRDFYLNGKRWLFRLHEKGGKFHEVPVHHTSLEYLDAYLTAVEHEPDLPLFRSANRRTGQLTSNRMDRRNTLRMIKRRARIAGICPSTCCHTFRATGITAYLSNGGTIENAQAIAAHESPRTTKLYDRTVDEITLDEVERIRI